jgi:hypothetical protein
MKEKIQLVFSSDKLCSCFLSLIFVLISVSLSAQTVTGTVLDEESKPVTGATVTVKGTNKATLTNVSGYFSINAGRSDVLLISYIGFITQEIPLNSRTTLSISLVRGEGTTIEEVVVTALGIKRNPKKIGLFCNTGQY